MGWDAATIADVCEPAELRDPRQDPAGKFHYVDISGIDRTCKAIAEHQTLSGADAPSRARKAIRKDDVLVSTVRPNLNAVAMVPADLDGHIASTGFCVLRPNRAVIEPRYLFYRTFTPEFVTALTARVRGISYPAVSDKDVKQVEVPLPPLAEQRRIVEILDRADDLRRLRAEADARVNRILPSLFVRMFGDPATNSMHWPIKRIGEMCDIVSGATPRTERPEFWGGGIPWATPKDLSEHDGWSLDRTARTLTGEGLASCSAAVIPEGSVLLSSRAPIGLVAVAGMPMCTNQGFKNLVCGLDVDPWYLFGWCRIRTTYLQSLGRGATFKEISKRIVESIELPLPPMQRQRRFRSRLMNLTSIHRARIQSARRIANLFRVLLGRAFSGSLTASWREAHMDEILQEMEQKASRIAHSEEVR